MKWWKILSLVIAGVYIIGAILSFSGEDSGKKPSAEEIFKAAGGMFVWLLISLGK